jgi:hypothetical protein
MASNTFVLHIALHLLVYTSEIPAQHRLPKDIPFEFCPSMELVTLHRLYYILHIYSTVHQYIHTLFMITIIGDSTLIKKPLMGVPCSEPSPWSDFPRSSGEGETLLRDLARMVGLTSTSPCRALSRVRRYHLSWPKIGPEHCLDVPSWLEGFGCHACRRLTSRGKFPCLSLSPSSSTWCMMYRSRRFL